MVQGLIGRKVGMAQVHDDEGRVVPVTILRAGPCIVVQRKEADRDGYVAVQIGLLEERERRPSRPLAGHLKPAGNPAVRLLREFPPADPAALPEIGQKLDVGLFAVADRVDVIGRSRGRGFAGVVRRHHFRGGAATHGSMFHRAPGSIGASSFPSRVFPGTRMPGRMGNRRVTVRNLEVVQVDREKNLLVVRGAVPGPRKSVVLIRKAGSAGAAAPGRAAS